MIYNKNSEANISLRSLLEGEGYSFPCGGKGLCGKCRIVAPALPITELDRRFLSETELDRGERLACNKVISAPIEITEISLPKFVPQVKVKEGGIVALLYPNRTELALTDMENEKLVETLILPTASSRSVLRSIVGKNAVELFEKYNLATAPTIVMSGDIEKISALLDSQNITDGSLNAVEYALPGDELYLSATCRNALGTTVMEALDEEDGTLVMEICADEVCLIFKNSSSSQGAVLPYAEAFVKAKELAPAKIVIIGGDSKGDFAKEFSTATFRSPKALAVAVAAVTSLRKRSKLRNFATQIVAF